MGFLIVSLQTQDTPAQRESRTGGCALRQRRNFLGGREPSSLATSQSGGAPLVPDNSGQAAALRQPKNNLSPNSKQWNRLLCSPCHWRSYDLAIWKRAKLHRDCYVVFENAYYSGPFRLVGEYLYVRGGSQEVRLYTS